MKTFEQELTTWNSGFRGYRDMSPEAIQRRRQQRAEQLLREGVITFTRGVITTIVGSEMHKILEGSPKICKRVR